VAERKVVALEHLSLDGVIQGPGRKEEDPSGGFAQGGWTGLISDPSLGPLFDKQLHQRFDLLLGRRTYDIWEQYWPHHDFWPEANVATKYVASRTRTHGEWDQTVFLNGNLAESVTALKSQEGPDLHVWGSSQVVQELVRHDLIDEFWLVIYPIVVGSGKRLFAWSSIPLAYRVTESTTTPRGILVVRYQRSKSLN